uniref:Uncharacterized protein n=1 Tax=Amblyomma maculatum TaxID=34609 RepID=G3MQK0_AMBMU
MRSSIGCVVVLVVLGVFVRFTEAMITDDPECHRMRTKVDKVRSHCVYLCHTPEGYIRMGVEDDGTPCRYFLQEGVCQRGLCLLDKPKKGVPAEGDGGVDKKAGTAAAKDDQTP